MIPHKRGQMSQKRFEKYGCREEARVSWSKAGRHKHPTAGCADSQSVKTTAIAGVRGYDSGKQVKGRKRHILVNTLGLLLAAGDKSSPKETS